MSRAGNKLKDSAKTGYVRHIPKNMRKRIESMVPSIRKARDSLKKRSDAGRDTVNKEINSRLRGKPKRKVRGKR